jgi:hypothetical protein
MKVHIDELHEGGMHLPGGADAGVRITYSIIDGETGEPLRPETFSSYQAAEACLLLYFSGSPRWAPPSPTTDEFKDLERLLIFLEAECEDRWSLSGPAARDIWARVTYYLHQRTLGVDVVERIRKVLENNPFDK